MQDEHNDGASGPVRRRLEGVNIPPTERTISALAGAALAAIGLRQRGLVGGVLAGLGAALIARGVSGRSAGYRQLSKRAGVDVQRDVIVQRPRAEVYAALRDLRRLPRFLTPLVSVEEIDTASHWVAKVGPIQLEWMSEITDEVDGERLAWHSIPGGDLDHEGSIVLADVADGPAATRVTVALHFEPPAGTFAAPLRGLMRVLTRSQLARDLERLRGLLEDDPAASATPAPPQRMAEVTTPLTAN